MSLDVYDDIESCFDAGWSDGLPVIPPYGSLVDRMLGAMGWGPSEVIGTITAQDVEIRAEHLAAAAVMAGCKPEYGPLLRALSQALCDPLFAISGVEVTTGGVAAMVIVSGPVVAKMGFEHEANCLGANTRVNATIGRFAQMVRLFCGRAGGSLDAHGTLGHPGRLSFLVAEHPETYWGPFHTQNKLAADVSAVSLMAVEGPNSVNNHYGDTGEQILLTIADCLAHAGSTNFYYRQGGYAIVIAPDHMELVAKDFSRDEAREFLYKHATRPTDWLRKLGRIANQPLESAKVEPGMDRSPVSSAKQLSFIESGAPGGRFSAIIPRWVANNRVVSRVIEEI